MKVKPLYENVLSKRLSEEEKTKGGIIIPDSAKEKPKEGKVISTGDGRILKHGKTAPHQIKTGNKVLFSKYAGTEIKIDGEDHIIMSEEEILAVLD